MKAWESTVLIAFAANLVLVASQPCPTWFIREGRKCKCGLQYRNLLECSQADKETKIVGSHCLTYSNDKELEYFGACPYNTKSSNSGFNDVPSNVTEVNEVMCGPLNRTGLLCSKCQPGLGPAVFSYYRECKECMTWPYGWIVYFVRLIVPLTLFCLVVMVFQINIASPALNGFVLATQLLSSALNNNPFLVPVLAKNYTLTKFIVDFFGIFNLDFFMYLLPSFCIREEITMYTVIALDYCTALYPILLTVIIYLCITLHDKGYRVVVICWKPFHKCLTRFRRSWNPKGSVLNSFCTFILLSQCKMCLASVHLVQPVRVSDKHGNVIYRMYFDAQYGLNGRYILWVTLAVIAFTAAVLLPAFFLLFYQNKLFQKCLSSSGFKFKMIHELASITQGCYKNGTGSSTQDYRWFAGLYQLFRIVVIASLSQTHHILVYVTVFSTMALLIAGLRPYKNNYYNLIDSVYCLIAGIGVSWYSYFQAYDMKWSGPVEILGSILFLYAGFCALWTISASVVERIRVECLKNKAMTGDSSRSENIFPHRLLEPNEYKPLLDRVHLDTRN